MVIGRTQSAEATTTITLNNKKPDNNKDITGKNKELSPLEIAQIGIATSSLSLSSSLSFLLLSALDVAIKKNHVFMQSLLREKISKLVAEASSASINDFRPELDDLLFR